MVGWLFRSTPKNSVNSLSLCTRVAFSTFSTRLTNFSYSFCNTNKKTSHEVRHRASATDNTTSHLYERPFLQELLAGGAGLWGGGEVDRGSPDSDSVPPAERHPEPRERSSLAARSRSTASRRRPRRSTPACRPGSPRQEARARCSRSQPVAPAPGPPWSRTHLPPGARRP